MVIAMGYQCFDVDVTDKVAHIKMNRPEKANSMIAEFWNELPEIVNEHSRSGLVRTIVLSGEGRHFCAGMDLAVFGSTEDLNNSGGSGFRSRRNERQRGLILKLQDSFSALENARVPVLAAIQGACVGGAIDMVTACDMRYATEDAFFSIAEVNIGMTADVGTLQRFPKLVPEGIVRELAYTGRKWTSADAAQLGFVNAVFPDQETMMESVFETAAEIASKSPMAVWGTKRTLNFVRDHSVADGLEFIANWNSGALDSDDMKEAMTAQMEKRPAEFPDLWPESEGL